MLPPVGPIKAPGSKRSSTGRFDVAAVLPDCALVWLISAELTKRSVLVPPTKPYKRLIAFCASALHLSILISSLSGPPTLMRVKASLSFFKT
jgi:hypothetical protein